MQKQINVALGNRSYPIYICKGMDSSFADICRQHSISDPVVIITDRNVAKYHLKSFRQNLVDKNFQSFMFEIPAGESQKSINRVNSVVTELLEKRVPRSATIIAFGGGVIGDLAGFIAAVYQRGVRLIQVPTTLLAQIDSSIGGKVGINHPLGKNMIGAFYQPVLVWSDIEYLSTLPKREIICGLGEVVKYGIIRNPDLFDFLEANMNKVFNIERQSILHIVEKCAKIKADVVSQDERESGLRVILNCGHTIGHGLEAGGKYKLLKHGEAVLLGLIAESYISKEMGLLDAGSYERIVALIERIPIKVRLSLLRTANIFTAIGRDKKRITKKSRFVLPVKIGDVKVVEDVDVKLVQKALKQLIK